MRQKSVLISGAGMAGPALVYGLMRRFVTDQFQLPDYPA
jgi:2-polyprenyl-6-methoxyphenol hydroxylase-like FAD-dependent oxidoreductase